MTFPAAAPKTFQVPSRREGNLIPHPRQTGQVAPETLSGVASAVTQDGPVAKPWAHFVAGGYDHPGGKLIILNTTNDFQHRWHDRRSSDFSSGRS